MAASEHLRCVVELRPDEARVRPAGELDVASVPCVEERLRDLRASGFQRLVVDLRGLDFLDSSGVHLLERWARLADCEEFRFAVVPGPADVRRAISLAGAHERLPWTGPSA